MMSDLKWEYRSSDWRKGWRYGQGDTEVTPQFDSVEFCDGYRYALERPVGGCYSASATTGK